MKESVSFALLFNLKLGLKFLMFFKFFLDLGKLQFDVNSEEEKKSSQDFPFFFPFPFFFDPEFFPAKGLGGKRYPIHRV